ncbi:MAG: tetratricopeptide repeat protein [Rickettsiales bacterium]|nr:tetratricopeptide repeat protein [Rickettsiales bacterium]
MFGKDKLVEETPQAVEPEVSTAEDLSLSNIADGTPEASEAKALVLTGQFTQAEYLLEQLLEKNPANCDAWHALGHARRLQNKLPEALEAYSHAIEVAYRYHSIIHFEHSAACLQRALLLFAMGEAEKAKADIEMAIFQDHNNQPALTLQQNGWQRGMELAEYESNLMTAVACETEIRRKPCDLEELLPYQQAHDTAIYYWRHGHNEHAIGLMSEMLKQNKDYSMAWHHRALMFLELQDTRQAQADLEKSIEAGQNWHKSYHHDAALHHFHRGQLQQQMGDHDMAMMDFNKAIDIDKGLALAHVALAHIHRSNGQIPDAITDLNNALAVDPRPEWQELLTRWTQAMVG